MYGYAAVLALLAVFLFAVLIGVELFVSHIDERPYDLTTSDIGIFHNLLYENGVRSASVDCSVDGHISCDKDVECAAKCVPTAGATYCDIGTGRCFSESSPERGTRRLFDSAEPRTCTEDRGLVRVLYRNEDGDVWDCANFTAATDRHGRVHEWSCAGGRVDVTSFSYAGRAVCTCPSDLTAYVISKDIAFCTSNVEIYV